MVQFTTYTPPPVEEGDTWSMREVGLRGGQIVAKVLKFIPSVVTVNSPEGTAEIRLDVVDLGDPKQQYVYRNVPVWTGAVVDGLKEFAGKPDLLVLDVSMKKGKSGRDYPIVNPATDTSVAERFWSAKGDPFAAPAPTFTSAGPGGGFGSSRNDDPPF